MLGVHRFGAASPAAANRGRAVPTNTLGSSARGTTSRALDCRPDAAGAVHCVSPGAFDTVEVARDGAPIDPEPAAARSKRAELIADDDHDATPPRELLRRDELLRRLACVPDDATGALRCSTPGAFPVVAVAPDGGPIVPADETRSRRSRSPRSRETEPPVERLGAARGGEKNSAHHPAHAAATKGEGEGAAKARASCRPGVDGSMRCDTPGAFPAVNPDALDVPDAKTSRDSTASTGKARRSHDASSSVEKKDKASSSSSSEKKASKKKVDAAADDENAEEAKADPESSDPDGSQMLEETDAVTVDEMAGERRERHPAAYRVVNESYEARREKLREAAARAEREAAKATSPGEDASALAESEIKSWEKSATTEITPDRMAQFKETEMEGAEEPMDGEVDEVPKRLHEPKLFCSPDADGKMKCAHSLVAASQ